MRRRPAAATPATPPRARGCNPVRHRLHPYVVEATTLLCVLEAAAIPVSKAAATPCAQVRQVRRAARDGCMPLVPQGAR